MTRILFFVAIIAVIYFGWRSMRMKQMELEKRLDRQEKAAKKAPGGEHMVPCAHCGVYVPESEAIQADGKYYCSSEHRRLGPGSRR